MKMERRVLKVTVQEAVIVAASPEKVWDYTQDWNHRREWDDSVREVLSQTHEPHKRVKARFMGGMVFDIEYKLNDRPRKTSLAMVNGTSRWIVGGGGSWRYDGKDGGTVWVQTNTLVLADHLVMKALWPLLQMAFRWSTRHAMRKAKKRLES